MRTDPSARHKVPAGARSDERRAGTRNARRRTKAALRNLYR
jgi:hypothetical protein